MSEDSNIVCHSPFMVGESRSVWGDGSEGDDAIRGVVDQVSSIPGELVVATPVDVFVARE
jgi:hypothetical protein